jgi:hypothetical protein
MQRATAEDCATRHRDFLAAARNKAPHASLEQLIEAFAGRWID